VRESRERGNAHLECSNHFSISAFSYVKPSAATTGLHMSVCEIGHVKSLGTRLSALPANTHIHVHRHTGRHTDTHTHSVDVVASLSLSLFLSLSLSHLDLTLSRSHTCSLSLSLSLMGRGVSRSQPHHLTRQNRPNVRDKETYVGAKETYYVTCRLSNTEVCVCHRHILYYSNNCINIVCHSYIIIGR